MIFLLALGRLYGNRFVAELKICNGSLPLPHQCSYPAQEVQGATTPLLIALLVSITALTSEL
ncbi:MAG: hypothetical protein DMF14_02965 [Verrucomicrobia bacterium]|nr:MAG: hypothetical protein DMF14_02965 [Verrucomicrobiota bacterium]